MIDKYSISLENLINLELAFDSDSSDLDLIIQREVERISFTKSSKKFNQIYSFMKSKSSFKEINQVSNYWGNNDILCEMKLNDCIYRLVKLSDYMYLSNRARYVLLRFKKEESEKFLSEEYLRIAKLNKSTYFHRILCLYFDEDFIQNCFDKLNT